MWASFWGQKILHVGRIHAAFVDRVVLVLHPAFASISLRLSSVEAFGAAKRCSRAFWDCFSVDDTTSLQLCVSISITKILAESA